LNVDDSPIHEDDMNSMDEAFLSSTGIGIYPAKWDGYAPAAYPITEKLRAAVDRQIMIETGADRQIAESA
jgi:branched-subunit amino acid aminotransferase/4-amino-4-deoxychorismate lyase